LPTQILYGTTPVKTSIVSYDLTDAEELFLSFTWDRKEGPPLWRNGTRAPEMKVINTTKQMTSNPVALRLGTWRVRETLGAKSERERDKEAIADALKEIEFNSPDKAVLEQMLREAETLPSHEKLFRERCGDYRIVGLHGCGDLTMNEWNVAYAGGNLTEAGATIVALPGEKFEDRRYSCLVKWKAIGTGRPRLSIEEVRFSRLSEIERGKTNNLVAIRDGDCWLPRADSIEFAVSNQQIIRDGKVVSAIESCHQFGDLRHLLQLPNLNPDALLLPGETRPFQRRRLFGVEQRSDIWLGEKFLIAKNNLLRAALSGPITISVPQDCRPDHLRAALSYARYEEVLSPTAPLAVGQWRETDLKEDVINIEIHFRRNRYAWNMLGLTQDHTQLLSAAFDADPKIGSGFVLEDAAAILRDYGAWDALLVDEGADVFQLVDHGSGDLDRILDLKRTRLRAVFIVGKRTAKQQETVA
jgi:hypothetical protein